VWTDGDLLSEPLTRGSHGFARKIRPPGLKATGFLDGILQGPFQIVSTFAYGMATKEERRDRLSEIYVYWAAHAAK